MAETKYVCVPERWLTSDQLAAAPQSHVAIERRYLEIVVKLAAGRKGGFMGDEARAIAHCRALLAKE